MEDIRDPQQRREMIERLQRESAETRADMERRKQYEWQFPSQSTRAEPMASPPVRKSADGGLLYRDPQAAADLNRQRDQDWANWFRDRFAEELTNGAGGEAIIHLVLGHVEPLSREISDLRKQVRALTKKSAPRSRR
jgi:hypothetical protein